MRLTRSRYSRLLKYWISYRQIVNCADDRKSRIRKNEKNFTKEADQ
jgi:hypothetical protein